MRTLPRPPRPLRRLARLAATGSPATRELGSYRRFLRESEGYGRGFFNVTVDLELAWSIARRGDHSTSVAESLARARRARANLPALLELCEEFEIPMTFAVVGHVALRGCEHSEPPPFAPSWMPGDWYAVDPHGGLTSNTDYFGADLVDAIRAGHVDHELASHGFAHVDLGDSETTAEVAGFELTESFRLLSQIDERLTTLVFPKNHPGFLELVRAAGYTIYRSGRNEPIAQDGLGMWHFPCGFWLAPTAVSVREVVRFAIEAIRRSQLANCYFHLYEFEAPQELARFIEPIFRRLAQAREAGDVQIETMRGVVHAVARG